MNVKDFPEQTFSTIQEAINAASMAAVYSHGQAYPGILYRQGGRRIVCACLPCERVIQLVNEPKVVASKHLPKFDVEHERNRPLEPKHVQQIQQYLVTEEEYILPPIMLNSLQPLQIFTISVPSPVVPCFFVLPPHYRLHVTDGQHRIEGLRKAMAVAGPQKFANDSVGVSIVEEDSIEKTHQDFYDAAQVKPLAPAMLVEYDQREPLNKLTRDLVKVVPIFQDRTLRIGRSVGKNSPMIFTNNMIRRAIVAFVAGDPVKEEVAAHAVSPKQEMWRKRLSTFLVLFSETNEQWRMVMETPRETGEVTPVPAIREKYLHFSSGGLQVIAGVGYAILKTGYTSQEGLTSDQEALVKRLAQEIDWRKDAPLWKRSIISGAGKITASWAFLSVGVADVKRAIGLELSEKESALLRRADDGSLTRKA